MRSTGNGRSDVQTLSRHPTPRLPKVERVVLAASNACLRQRSGVVLTTTELGVECRLWICDSCTLWVTLLSGGILHITSVSQAEVITYHCRA